MRLPNKKGSNGVERGPARRLRAIIRIFDHGAMETLFIELGTTRVRTVGVTMACPFRGGEP